MSTVTFDTMDFRQRLLDAGFTEKQAEAMVRSLSDAQSTLVTREYLDARLSGLKVELVQWMVGLMLAQTALLLGILFAVVRLPH